MQETPIFELPKEELRIWDQEVPIITKGNVITAYLTGKIQEPHYYNELCYMLNTSDKDTSFELHINTPGGIIDSAFMVTAAISTCKSKVTAHLSGTVASAGTLIAMSCHSVVPAPHLSFMIHNYSGGMSGKGHEMKARQKFTDAHLNEAFKSFYSGFLKDDEMSNVLEGTDLWMGTDEVMERWDGRVAYVNSTEGN